MSKHITHECYKMLLSRIYENTPFLKTSNDQETHNIEASPNNFNYLRERGFDVFKSSKIFIHQSSQLARHKGHSPES